MRAREGSVCRPCLDRLSQGKLAAQRGLNQLALALRRCRSAELRKGARRSASPSLSAA